MRPSTRIAVNTLATYARSLLAFGLALFSSRWVLNALGATDYGLFNVVGSLIAFVTFINTIMATSAARHFAYAHGKGDAGEVNGWFNTSLAVHLTLAVILVVIGWPIAEHLIRHVLSIPAERIEACIVVFRLSVIGAFISMVSIPFVGMFTAKQRLTEIALWGIFCSVLSFILAYILTRVSGDRLIFYASYAVALNVFVFSIQIIRALKLFPECRVSLVNGFEVNRAKRLFSFAGWNSIGVFASTLSTQGTAILVNLHFGPGVNAALGIATQVSTQVNQLSASMMVSLVPEIVAREGRGERGRMLSLAHQSSKYATLLVLVFALPLLAEMDYVLKLWLKIPPEYTAVLCRIILASFLVSRLVAGYAPAVNALGRMAGFHSTVGGLALLVLPIAWLFFRAGWSPASLGFSFLMVAVAGCILTVLWMKVLFGTNPLSWVRLVLLPCTMVAAAGLAGALSAIAILPPSFWRLVLATTLSIAGMLAVTLLVCLNSEEKALMRQMLQSALGRLGSARTGAVLG